MKRESTPRPFPDDYYEYTREYLTNLINKYSHGWLENPRGPLTSRMGDFDSFPSGYLVCLAQALTILGQKIQNVDDSVLAEKFIALLHSENEKQFEEVLSEIKIGAFLAQRYDGIMFEPIVFDNDGKAKKPSSPDYQVSIGGEEIFVEVTVFHMGQLDQWDKSVSLVKKDLERHLMKADTLYREIEVEMPLNFKHRDISNRKISKLASKIFLQESGEAIINIKRTKEKGYLRWKTPAVPIITDLPHNENALKYIPADQSAVITGPSGMNAPFMLSTKEKLSPTDATELLYKSLENSLKKKKRQRDKFQDNKPYILAMELGHGRLFPDSIISLVLNRFWPNPKYKWMLGIMQHSIKFTWQGPESKVVYLPNSNADERVNKIVIDSINAG